MVRGRGGQPTRGGRGGNQMGTRGGRVTKNTANLDFGFSSSTKSSYGRGGYNNSNANQNYGNTRQQPQQQQNYNNNAGNNKRYNNNPNNNANNRNYSGGNNNPNNQKSGGNNSGQQYNRGNNQNRPQGQGQNYNNSVSNRNPNNNQGYNNRQNQGYNRQQNQNFNDGNDSGYSQRGQNSNQGQGYNNNRNNQGFDNFGPQSGGGIQPFDGPNQRFDGPNQPFDGPKPSLLGVPNSAPVQPAPARNEPSSDDILKEIGKVFLTSMASGGPMPQGVNPMMQQMMQGPGGPPPNPSRYDNFYNDGNQFTNYNPPAFNNYRGGYNPRGRGGMAPRGGVNSRGAVRGGRNNNPQNRRVQGTPQAGVKKQPFKSKNNPNFKAGTKGPKLSVAARSIKYTLQQLSKALDENNHPLAAFLRQTFYDLSTENRTHFLLLSRILLKHQNVIKLLTFEVKKALDKKFGEGTDEETLKKKNDLLKEKKTKFFTEYKNSFKDAGNLVEKEKALDDVLPVLTGEKFTDDHVPKPEDYVTNLDAKEEDYILAFKIAFVKTCFEKFLYRLNNAPMPSKNVQKRLKFFLDNGFLSHLIVDKVKLKANAKVPTILAKYTKLITQDITKTKIENTTKSSYDLMVKENEQVQTDISEIIGGEKVGAEVLRDFADCIILFDRIATALKFKLLRYTPYINLTAEQKQSLFNELVTSIYKTSLDLLKNKVKTSEKKFEDMEKDEATEGESNTAAAVAAVEEDDDEAANNE